VAQAFVALGADDDLALQAFLNDIRGIVNTIASSITGSTATAQAAVDALQVAQASATSESADIATALTNIDSEATSARSSANAAHADVIQAEAQVAAARTKVTSIGDGGAVADQLSSASYSELLGYFTAADAETGQAKSAINSSIGNLDTIDSEVVDGQAAQAQLATDLVTIGNQAIIVETQLGNIDAAITTGFEDAIGDILDLIFDHVDSFLADDCKANLVQVPILARDVNGFYVAPSAALINALQAYLEGIKEVTQVPEVVSGEPWLVYAAIEGVIGVKQGYVKPTVLSNVLKALDDILRDREFGQNLYLNEVMSVAQDPLTGIGGVEGVGYAKLRITGPTAYLDSTGQNLVITKNLIITKGTVAITTETAVTT
jgi:hypothetical protein